MRALLAAVRRGDPWSSAPRDIRQATSTHTGPDVASPAASHWTARLLVCWRARTGCCSSVLESAATRWQQGTATHPPRPRVAARVCARARRPRTVPDRRAPRPRVRRNPRPATDTSSVPWSPRPTTRPQRRTRRTTPSRPTASPERARVRGPASWRLRARARHARSAGALVDHRSRRAAGSRTGAARRRHHRRTQDPRARPPRARGRDPPRPRPRATPHMRRADRSSRGRRTAWRGTATPPDPGTSSGVSNLARQVTAVNGEPATAASARPSRRRLRTHPRPVTGSSRRSRSSSFQPGS